ncbi:MAG: chitobiase/beta-hexosaminidase C-terminal domain-containing protein [Anaerohalosphaeraceae bacterium]
MNQGKAIVFVVFLCGSLIEGSVLILGGTAMFGRSFGVLVVLVVLSLSATVFSDGSNPAIIYVNASATGTNTGESWVNAFQSLQSALDAAINGTEIWVAAGTYKPTKEIDGTGSQYKSFQLKNGVGVYGGFNGTEVVREQRDWEVNQTILSGDLNGDDNDNIAYDEPTRKDNCRHVFNLEHVYPFLETSAVLDGVVITGGNGPWGGGISNDGKSCPTLSHCVFRFNAASDIGGAIYNGYFCMPVISNCIFSSNCADRGGGVGNSAYAKPVIINTIFDNNIALQNGGGIFHGFSDTTIISCTFKQNFAGHNGGAIYNDTSWPKLINCIFANNFASTAGGGIANERSSSSQIINCTFSSNIASLAGGGIYNNSYSNATIINSILWHNTAYSDAQIYIDSTSKSIVSYSDIQGGWAGTCNLDLDPYFVNATEGDLRLRMNSSCIDNGDNTAIPTDVLKDLEGLPRIQDGNGDNQTIVDMGAYEFVYNPSLVALPYFSTWGGLYNLEQIVSITCATPGATIHYTTNGLDPTESDPVIVSGDSFYVDRNMTLKAKAWKDAMIPSATISATFDMVVSTPTFSQNGGTFDSKQTIIISCATAGATIHYTTNGLEPTEDDPVITSGFSVIVDRSMTLKAKAWKGSMTPSAIKSDIYTLFVLKPTFSVNSGTYDREQVVTIVCVTTGVTIHYTTNGVDPDENDPVITSGSSVIVDRTMTLKAKAWKGVMKSSEVESATYKLISAIPVFSLGGGTYNNDQTVAISCVTPDAIIKYTIDGSDPNNGILYSQDSPILVDHPLTLKARAWKGAMTPSPISSVAYTLMVSTPSFSKSSGKYNNEQAVTIGCETIGATIHYTTNGINPTESDPVLNPGGSIIVDRSMTLKAKAWKGTMVPSATSSVYYTLVVALPTFSKGGGVYNNEQAVTIACETSGAVIHYTTNGINPTENDRVIASGDSILVDRSMTLKAKAWKGAMMSSAVISAAYELVTAMPVFTPDSGIYAEGQYVTITCETRGATIYYTTNGSDPTVDSAVIEQGNEITVSVDPATILKAIAYKGFLRPSGIKKAVYRLAGIVYVNAEATGANTGMSWADAFTELQSALEMSFSGDEIWVAKGTYKPTQEVGGTDRRYRSFQLKNGIGLYGGFNGTEIDREQRDWKVNLTILSGDLDENDNDNIAYNESSRQDNCYHVFYHPDGLSLNNTAVLDGCVIIGGNANVTTSNDSDEWRGGGGMYNYDSSPTITYCVFKNNSVYSCGGGIYNSVSSNPIITNCAFSNNNSYYYGGGMYNAYANPTINNCVFDSNSSGIYGGGLCNEFSNPMICNCIFAANMSNQNSGMYNSDSNPVVMNCVFSDNSAKNCVIYNIRSCPVITNCTFYRNTATVGSIFGIYNTNNSQLHISNTVLWNDLADAVSKYAIFTVHDSVAFVSNCITDQDPKFISTDPGSLFYLRLQADSPCIDKGSNAAIPAGVVADMDRTPRIVDGNCDDDAIVDMGAYEYFLTGDLNTTCSVDVDDLSLFGPHWLAMDCIGPDNCGQADIDRNGMVELVDFAILAGHWMED